MQLDLDQAWLGWPGELLGQDVSLTPGYLDAQGRILSVRLHPQTGFSLAKPAESLRVPERSECEQLRAFSAGSFDLIAEDEYYCVHTSDGRLGYMLVKEINFSTGLGLAWYLWDQSGEVELDIEYSQPQDSDDQFVLAADIAPVKRAFCCLKNASPKPGYCRTRAVRSGIRPSHWC